MEKKDKKQRDAWNQAVRHQTYLKMCELFKESQGERAVCGETDSEILMLRSRAPNIKRLFRSDDTYEDFKRKLTEVGTIAACPLHTRHELHF